MNIINKIKDFELSDRSKIIKNLISINISFVFIFSAMNASASVQPVLNQSHNLGLITRSMLYGVQIVTSLVVPGVVCEYLGHKWALFISELCFFFYIGFQAFPSWETLIPSKINNWIILLP